MDFFYPKASLPQDDKLLEAINAAAMRIYDKLNQINVQSLEISDHAKSYLNRHKRHLFFSLRRFTYLLAWSVANFDKPLNDFVLIENGGGTGLLSCLAKELGIGRVIYNDIYDLICNDARIIAKGINNEADYYVLGDIDDLLNFLNINSIKCNTIVSTDLIEHIYDIDEYLVKLSKFPSNKLTLLMSTGANHYNPIVKRGLVKKQIKLEHIDREMIWGHRKRNCLKAYYNARKDIIKNQSSTLSNNEIKILAENTKGLIEKDIIACVNRYSKTGKFPSVPKHPTNTCDPYTGNWAEHLMDINHLQHILAQENFQVKTLGGYYSVSPQYSYTKRLITTWLNRLISKSNGRALFIAPYYTIYAQKVDSGFIDDSSH